MSFSNCLNNGLDELLNTDAMTRLAADQGHFDHVEITETLQTPQGLLSLVVPKKGRTYSDQVNYPSGYLDTIGDVALFLNSQPTLLNRFGFRPKIGPTGQVEGYYFPDSKIINKVAVELDNITLRFKETGDELTGGEEYLDLFLKGEMPLAKDGRLKIHDLQNHFYSQFIPLKEVQAAQRNIKGFLDFKNFLKTKYPELHDYQFTHPDGYDVNIEFIMDDLVSMLDVATANIHHTLAIRLAKPNDFNIDTFATEIGHIFFSPRSSSGWLNKYFLKYLFDSPEQGQEFRKAYDKFLETQPDSFRTPREGVNLATDLEELAQQLQTARP